MKRIIVLLVTMAVLVTAFTGCGKETLTETVYGEAIKSGIEAQNEAAGTLLLATTTSTRDSGLLDYILDDFSEEIGIEVKVIAVGTGKALQMGRDGEVDVLLVHAKSSEETFVAEGYGTERFDVMYNDFIIVGPSADPAGISTVAPNDVLLALKTIYDAKSTFVSRGDDSGTNKKEIALWTEADIIFDAETFYVSAGKGMGDVLMMTSEMEGYTLTDRATYLSMMDKLEIEILVENDNSLFNQYGVIPVNPKTNELINHDGAMSFAEWLLSDEIQAVIGEYGKEKFGMPLFTPNAK